MCQVVLRMVSDQMKRHLVEFRLQIESFIVGYSEVCVGKP